MSMIDIDNTVENIEIESNTEIIVVNPADETVSVILGGPQGPPGPSGSGGGTEGFDFTQSVVSTTWTINHNLGHKPSVQTFTVGGLLVIGGVQHISNNQVVVTFNTPIAGTARLV